MASSKFPKRERLCSRKAIEALFGSGSRGLSAFPLRAVYRLQTTAVADTDTVPSPSSAEPPVRLLVSVSKRHFRHAVDRNRAKRQLREGWRLNRDLLNNHIPEGTRMDLALIWLADTPQTSELVGRKLKNLLCRIQEALNPKP